MATSAARRRRRENPVQGVSCTCSKCCADSCSACHHNYVKPVSNCMGAIRTMVVPSNNRVQIVPIITEQSNGVQPILMTRKGGRTRRKKRRKSRRRKRGGGYTFGIYNIGDPPIRYVVKKAGAEIIKDDGKIKLYDYLRVINNPDKKESWYDIKYNPNGNTEQEKGGAFIRMHSPEEDKKGGRTRRRKRKRRRKRTKKKRRRRKRKRTRSRKGGWSPGEEERWYALRQQFDDLWESHKDVYMLALEQMSVAGVLEDQDWKRYTVRAVALNDADIIIPVILTWGIQMLNFSANPQNYPAGSLTDEMKQKHEAAIYGLLTDDMIELKELTKTRKIWQGGREKEKQVKKGNKEGKEYPKKKNKQ